MLESLHGHPAFKRMMQDVRAEVDAGRARVEAATLPPTDEDFQVLVDEARDYVDELSQLEERWPTLDGEEQGQLIPNSP